jgi:hypothetical protein
MDGFPRVVGFAWNVSFDVSKPLSSDEDITDPPFARKHSLTKFHGVED